MLAPEDIELLRGRNFGHFVTIDEDGSPQATPLWIDVDDDGDVLVNTAAGRRKDRNVRRDPRVAISVHEQANPYRWLSINGTVVELVEGPDADAHIDALCRAYDGVPWSFPEDERDRRVILRIAPLRVVRMA
jgi:PPOX class probable F420-dependent enzyme